VIATASGISVQNGIQMVRSTPERRNSPASTQATPTATTYHHHGVPSRSR
jgi:hypothetical protein